MKEHNLNLVNVSYIVAIYNIEEYILDKCISSIVKCMGMYDEVLLIDDGSTAEYVVDTCAKYVSDRVKYYFKPNGGVSSARNLGIKNARGKYIAFIDGDDYIENGYTQMFEKMQNKDICLFNYKCYDNGVFTLKRLNGEVTRIKIINSILNCNEFDDYFIGVIWNKLFSRDFLLKHNLFFNEGIKKDEDGLFVFKCMLKNPSIEYIDFECYVYYINQNSVCHKFNPQINQLFIKALNAWAEEVDSLKRENLIDEGILREGMNRQIFNALQGALHINAFNSNMKIPYRLRRKLAKETYREFNKYFDLKNLTIFHFYSNKNRIKFFLIKKRWFWLIWLYVKYTGKGL